MQRRRFLGLVGGATWWPFVARAQQAAIPVIGFLHVTSREATRPLVAEFIRGLAETGYIEGKNVRIEYRFGEGSNDRMPKLVEELVSEKVSVMVPIANSNSRFAAKAATRTIPIVFMSGIDPVQSGIVDSLNTPGGNITGVNLLASELVPKRLDMLLQTVPSAKSIAYLTRPNPTGTSVGERELAERAARTLGVQLAFAYASNPREIEEAFANVIRYQDALIMSTDSFLNFQNEQLVQLAARYSVPTN